MPSTSLVRTTITSISEQLLISRPVGPLEALRTHTADTETRNTRMLPQRVRVPTGKAARRNHAGAVGQGLVITNELSM